MASDIQFFGIGKVIEAYRAGGVSTWAVCQGSDILHVGDSAEDLLAFLTMLSNGTSVKYQLRVYKNVESDDVDSKTACSRSFKFKLDGLPGTASVSGVSSPAGSAMGRVQQYLEKQQGDKLIAMLERADKGDDKDDTWYNKLASSVLNGIAENPQQLPALIGAVRSLFMPQTTIPAVQVGNVQRVHGNPNAQPKTNMRVVSSPEYTANDGSTAQDENEELTAEEQKEFEDLAEIYERLKQKDKNILQHLNQLAGVAENNPGMFTMLISHLNNLK